MKTRSVFVCQECGYRSLKWLGKCPSCGAWGSLVEEVERGETSQQTVGSARQPTPLAEAGSVPLRRLQTGIGEFDRVMGGGIVPGSVSVIGGDPGVGKSTLMLQVCAALSHLKPLYVTGEESLEQIRYRAERLGIGTSAIAVLTEQAVEDIIATIEQTAPGLVVVDSIQTLFGRDLEALPGSISQVRYCAGLLVQLAKRTGIPVLLVGHVTKEGMLAGPKVLEHMVDVVVQFDSGSSYPYCVLRAVKNRYGSTNEIGVFQMSNRGLVEVSNPSALFLSEHAGREPGIAVTALIEGSRALLVEIQALVMRSSYGVPQRVATGFDAKRLQMLLAVLERRAALELSHADVFLNVVGGYVVQDPAADLAVCLALVSSLRNRPLPAATVAIGEVGLAGELRAVGAVETRLREAEKLGFRYALVPASAGLPKLSSLELVTATHLGEVISEYAC